MLIGVDGDQVTLNATDALTDSNTVIQAPVLCLCFSSVAVL